MHTYSIFRVYIDISSYKGAKRVRILKREKVGGKWTNKVVKHVGTARDDSELEVLKQIALQDRSRLIRPNQLSFDLEHGPAGGIFTLGTYYHGAELVFGDIFDSLGVSIGRLTPLLRLLTISRIAHPASKRDTAYWMEESLGSGYSLDQIYRFLDVVFKKRKQITSSVSHSLSRRYPGAMSFLLYDVTTLYFEISREDPDDLDGWSGLRKRGYSKDHRADLPQIVLGLCVNELGMPLSYGIYPGHTYEGRTLVDQVVAAKDTIGAKEMTVVADAGMLSRSNISLISDLGMGYIISARIKSLDKAKTSEIFSHDFSKAPMLEIRYQNSRLIISYSASRARADARRRQASISRLESLISSNRAIRKHQFLDLKVKQKPTINHQAIEDAARFDGLKGYLTNNERLSPSQVISHYNSLPTVEQSFRMTKSDLKVRPAFHQRSRRIEAHVVLCMISLTVMRILEHEVRDIGFTYPQAFSVISKTTSALIGNPKKSHLIPPLYSKEFKEILAAIRGDTG